MEITITQRDQARVLVVEGSVDTLSAEKLKNALEEQIEQGQIRLVADFSGVDYISSAGLRALLGPLKEIRQQGGELFLAAVEKEVERVLKLSGFTKILTVCQDVESALVAVGP